MKNVLLIDSGSGGLNVLKECIKVVPKCNYLLFCDSKNLPYGTKSKEQLIDITKNNLLKIKKFFDFDIVILACNTLTATVIDEMREMFKGIVFIGTVPAIKPAILEFEGKDIIVLCTSATLKHNKLIQKYLNSQITFLPFDELAVEIDKNLDDLSVLDNLLKDKLKGEFKAIVLGCTHYKGVEENLNRIFPRSKIFDSSNGVARRLKSFVQEDTFSFQVQIFCENVNDLEKFWWYFQNK